MGKRKRKSTAAAEQLNNENQPNNAPVSEPKEETVSETPFEPDPYVMDGVAVLSGRRRAGRILLVIAALLFTLLFAIAAGVSLALIDLEKTPKDMIGAIRGTDVTVAIEEARSNYQAIFEEAQAKITADLDQSQDIEVVPEETEPEDNGTEYVGSDVAGIETVVRAGTNDIIVYKPSDDNSSALSTQVITDPNANYPLPFSTVDYSYFDDALFIGDSRMLGFGLYSGLTNATFYAVTSFSLFRYETMPVVQTGSGKVPIFSALPYDKFTKIYIKVGLNELGGNDEQFMQVYDEFITKLREMEPRAIIYTHAVLPITAAKSATDHTHSNENIIKRNEALKQYAEEHKCYYIDVKPVVSEPDGSLMPEMAGDGIHLKAGYMELWKEYLRTHAVIFE